MTRTAHWAEIPRVAEREGGPCYVVVRTGSDKEWCVITFVPETTKVKDKMVYASTKATLQRHLGFQFFNEEKHANTIVCLVLSLPQTQTKDEGWRMKDEG